MSGALIVISPGLSSTVQDSGRMGFVRYGVSPSGAFDPLYHAIANRLVGNAPGEAAVELTLIGGEYEIDAPGCRLAVAGDFAVTIDEQPGEPWRSYTLHAGQRFKIGPVLRGLRGYLAAAFALPRILGSRSVHVRTAIGPFDGRALKTGDRLPLRSQPSKPESRFDRNSLPPIRTTLRVVLGPQTHHFAADDVKQFLDSEFEITPRCDRMGYQLQGPPIDYRKDIPLISEGIALGSLQVLGQGVVIITLVDRQTTGGYPKIATVITPDVRQLAHIAPGTKIRFEPIAIEEAQSIRRNYDNSILSGIDGHLTDIRGILPTTDRLLANNLISGVSDGRDL
jgi:biotin-dependent carboxylase-like uncharacterized protein